MGSFPPPPHCRKGARSVGATSGGTSPGCGDAAVAPPGSLCRATACPCPASPVSSSISGDGCNRHHGTLRWCWWPRWLSLCQRKVSAAAPVHMNPSWLVPSHTRGHQCPQNQQAAPDHCRTSEMLRAPREGLNLTPRHPCCPTPNPATALASS